MVFRWGSPMLDTAIIALLRTVLDEVCVHVSRYEIGPRTNVASKILEAARQGMKSADGLREVGREALLQSSAMSG